MVEYFIDETAARKEKEARSHFEYEEGSATKEYQLKVERIRLIAEDRKKKVDPSFYPDIDKLVDRYAYVLAKTTNEFNVRASKIPSVLITGTANYPVQRMKKRMEIHERKAKEAWEQLDSIENSINACGSSISANRSDALELLQAQLEKLKAEHKDMKDKNAQALKSKQPLPYATFELTTKRNSIKRLRQRIEYIQKVKASGTQTYSGILCTGDSYTLTRDGEAMYLYFQFEGKPNMDTCTLLKKNGYHWSPRNERWQRKITGNADWATKQLIHKS